MRYLARSGLASMLLVAALVNSRTGSAQSTAADNPGGAQIEEITVTATRREESLEKVPISVSAYTQDDLVKNDVSGIADIAKLTPGLVFTPATRGNTEGSSISIRGISSGAGSATVGLYVDDSPVTVRPDSLSSSNPYPTIFDLERVEVLRGPQGTLFGSGSEGGTIRFITPEPGLDKFTSYVKSDFASQQNGDPNFEIGAAAGGPIIDGTLGFRVSADYQRQGGYVDRISWVNQQLLDKDANWSDIKSFRAAMKYQPMSNLSATASIYYQDKYINDSSIYWEGYSNPAAHDFINANPLITPTRDGFTLSSLKIQWDFAKLSFISNTAYLARANDNTYDSTTLDFASFGLFGGLSPPASLDNVYSVGLLSDDQHTLTQEFRLQSNDVDSPLTWVLGAYYQHARQNASYIVDNPFIDQALKNAFGVGVQQIFGFGMYQGTDLLYSTSEIIDEETAGFGQVDYKITSALTATAGVRVSHHSYHETDYDAGPVVSTNGSILTSGQSGTPVTPKYGLSYQVNPDNLVYASASKGFRQGSTAAALGSRCASDAAALGISVDERPILPDFVWSYELGSKNRLFGGRAQLDWSVYWINWTNIQSSLTLPNCDVPTTANLGKATSKGVDFLGTFLATDHLTLSASLGYADAKYTTTTYGAGDAVIRSAGQPLPIPPWKAGAAAQYNFVAFSRNAYVRFDDQYFSHDNSPLDLASAATDPTLPRAPALNNLGARAGIKLDGWDVSVYGQNLTNDQPEFGRYRDTLKTFNYRGVTVAPLSFGVTALFRY